MKIKISFVTNSSTSSFVILVSEPDFNFLKELAKEDELLTAFIKQYSIQGETYNNSKIRSRKRYYGIGGTIDSESFDKNISYSLDGDTKTYSKQPKYSKYFEDEYLYSEPFFNEINRLLDEIQAERIEASWD